jgi:hypothetical protein
LQDAVIPAVNYLLGNTLKTNEYIDVALSSTETLVSHKLGRVPVGYVVVSVNAGAVVYVSTEATEATIGLKSSASCTARIIFF